MSLIVRFGAVASIKFLAMENIPRITVQLHYSRLGNARWAALVAVLPDNCHPSSSLYFTQGRLFYTGCNCKFSTVTFRLSMFLSLIVPRLAKFDFGATRNLHRFQFKRLTEFYLSTVWTPPIPLTAWCSGYRRSSHERSYPTPGPVIVLGWVTVFGRVYHHGT